MVSMGRPCCIFNYFVFAIVTVQPYYIKPLDKGFRINTEQSQGFTEF